MLYWFIYHAYCEEGKYAVKKALLGLISGLILTLSVMVWMDRVASTAWAAPDEPAPGPTPTRTLKPVVDGQARRAQVLAATGGAAVQPAGLGAQAVVPQAATWNVYDHYHFTDVAVDFSLAYTSTYGFYYVDDSATVPTGTLVNVGAAFDANYISVIGNFGHTPDVDGEPRVFVLLTDIPDEHTYDPGATTYVPCFFDPYHAHPGEPGSNGREMIFLDLNPTVPDSEQAGRCLAHQLALLVAYNYDVAEAYWADEGMAYLAEFVAGHGHRPEVETYLADPNVPLTGWSGGEADIGKVYLWTLYLRQRFGQAAVRQILHSPLHGLDPIEPVLGVTKAELFHQWLLANYLDDPVQAGGIYSYAEIDIVPSGADQVASFTRPPVYETVLVADQEYELISGTLSGYYAARYIEIGRSSGVEMVISDNAPDGPYGQSTLINNNARFFNWTGRVVDMDFSSGDRAILAVGLSRESGSPEYVYNAREYFIYDLYLPIMVKN
jgi:hypothetical protein